MTLEELLARESIRITIANYTMAGDRLRIDDFVAQFTEDGVLESDDTVASDAFHYRGRNELRDWLSRWSRPATGVKTHQATFVRHHLSSMQIELIAQHNDQPSTYLDFLATTNGIGGLHHLAYWPEDMDAAHEQATSVLGFALWSAGRIGAVSGAG